MYESSIVQHFTERGIQQGERKRAIEDVLDVLEIRFHPSAAQTLKLAIETIPDLPNLKRASSTSSDSEPNRFPDTGDALSPGAVPRL